MLLSAHTVTILFENYVPYNIIYASSILLDANKTVLMWGEFILYG